MAFSTDQRANQTSKENAEKNRKKEEAKEVLSTEAGVLQMASLAEEGGSMGRRIARELRQFEATGRVSNWLAGETIKAESKREVPSSVVDSFVRRGVVPSTFQVSPALPFGGLPQIAPTIPSAGGGGAATIPPHPWQVLLRLNEDGDPEFKVDLNSDLYSGLGDWSEVPITGLDTWIAASTGYVTLKGTVSSGVVVGAEIIGPLVDLPERVAFSGSTQTDFSTLLGYLFFQDGQITVRQISSQNFTLFNSCINGNPAIYPIVT